MNGLKHYLRCFMNELARKTEPAVTLFPYFIDFQGTEFFLVLKRSEDKLIDLGLINGVGGKVEAESRAEKFKGS